MSTPRLSPRSTSRLRGIARESSRQPEPAWVAARPRLESSVWAVVVLAIPLLACSGQDLSVGGGDPIEGDDVNDISSGSAIGTDASGAYLFTAFDVVGCGCREGSSSNFCGLDWTVAGDGLLLDQQDGALEMRLFESNGVAGDFRVAGGIDTDGAVKVGGMSSVSTESGPIGQATHLLEGSVVARGRVSVQWLMRAEFIEAGESFDCDLRTDVELVWWDPGDAASCADDNDCHPLRSRCVDDVCVAGVNGDVCTFNDDCNSELCVAGTCSAGAAGDACSFPNECASGECRDGQCSATAGCEVEGCADAGLRCFDNVCQAGTEGDRCETQLHCAVGLACVEGGCYDGSEGDPCDTSVQCDIGSRNCVRGRCYDGSAGDPCEGGLDCNLGEGLVCGSTGVCES